MTRTSPPQVAFNAGEIDPLLHARFDFQKYQTGLSLCHGFLPMPQGGVTRAPGTTFLGNARSGGPVLLVPFQFAADDAVVLEFTPGWMRVWRYGLLVQKADLSGPYELPVPFAAQDMENLRWVQSADVIYLADGRNPIQRLARLALNSWTIQAQVFDTGPFRNQNIDRDITIQPSGVSGTVTLTASQAVFDPDHVGALFQLKVTNNTVVPLWQEDETGISVGDLRRYNDKVYRFTAGTNSGLQPPVHDQGEQLYQNGIRYAFVSTDVGVVRILTVVSPTQATAEVLQRLPDALLSDPTYRWAEGAWSALRGYPACIQIFEQRLVAAGTPTDPRTVWFSSVGGYNDFSPSVEPDGSFAYSIAGTRSQNRITGLARGRAGLHIFALSEEYSSRAESRSAVIGPTNASFGLDGTTGAKAAQIEAPHGDPVFISRDQRRVMSIRYDLQADANRELNLSRTSQHLGNVGFVKLAWQQTPEPRAWVLRQSGDLAVMIYDDNEEILGWSTHAVAGPVVDICATQNAAGTEDEIWLAVDRGGATLSIERMDWHHHMFAALCIRPDPSSAPATFTSVSAPWLAGKAVLVEAVGAETVEIETTVPAGGAVDLGIAATQACIGLIDQTHSFETLDITAVAPNGSALGRLKKVTSVGIILHETAGGTVQAIEAHEPDLPSVTHPAIALLPERVTAEIAARYSGTLQKRLPTGHASKLSLRFAPYMNRPLTVLGVVPTVQEVGA